MTREPYPSDLTDEQWEVIQAVLPKPKGGRSGRPRTYSLREIWNAIFYQARTGCQWDALPVDFPPSPLVKHYFTVWTRDGTLTRLHNTLREQVRQLEARNATPTAAIIDSQSVKAAENVWRSSRGYDAGKKPV